MSITYDFKGHVALATGAASGMGLATARAFAHAGAAVTLADVTKPALQQAVDEITSAGGEAIGVVCDVSDEAEVAAVVKRTIASFGRLDAAFNNASIQIPASEIFSEHAHSRASEPKELSIVPGAGHVDLDDRVNLIPWDKLQSFFGKHLPRTKTGSSVGGRWLMICRALAIVAVSMFTSCAKGNAIVTTPQKEVPVSMQPRNDLASVAPALDLYRREALQANLWKRPQLSPRDRSIVTVAALIARNQTAEQAHYLALALDNGVRPGEISEIITHLAFYAGWGNAMATVRIAQGVFESHGVSPSMLPAASGPLLPLDQAAEALRAASVEENVGPVAPGLVEYTRDVLFNDLWLRPALAPRDRSLVTVSALIASGQVAQVTYHLNRAMDSGLTKEEAGEVITHLAYYSGWPNAFSAVPVAKDVFDERPR